MGKFNWAWQLFLLEICLKENKCNIYTVGPQSTSQDETRDPHLHTGFQRKEILACQPVGRHHMLPQDLYTLLDETARQTAAQAVQAEALQRE